jgi:ligand-binding SRPBCC domain-containing protein
VAERVREGLLIAHRVRPLAGIPMVWVSEITHVLEGERFIDEQRIGPYALWHHEHEFRDEPGGKTRVTDRVTYAMPFGPLGELARPFLVAPSLAKVFAYREVALRRLFPGVE